MSTDAGGLERAWLAVIAALIFVGGPLQLSAQPMTPSTPAAAADYGWGLKDLAGRDRSLEQSRGRVVFINLWATWCAPCIAELASIQRLHDSLAGAGVEFLIVSPEQPAPVKRFIRRRGHTFPVYLEAEPMPGAFGLTALPTTYVIDRNGTIVLKHRGAADWNTDAMRAFLRELSGQYRGEAANGAGPLERGTR